MAYKRIAIRQRYDAMAKKHVMLVGGGLLVGGLIGYWLGKPGTNAAGAAYDAGVIARALFEIDPWIETGNGLAKMDCHRWGNYTRIAKLNIVSYFRPRMSSAAWHGLSDSQVVSAIDAYCLRLAVAHEPIVQGAKVIPIRRKI